MKSALEDQLSTTAVVAAAQVDPGLADRYGLRDSQVGGVDNAANNLDKLADDLGE